ncbi:MAG: hypothetical protein A2W25_15775 [candidate division Zixibacteria bacterium RBG_16_53_22]|nr:MAG: hypothetical protein A2W25_15775 [candidate division Zixibacteria bacterium RBG_16_53_22]
MKINTGPIPQAILFSLIALAVFGAAFLGFQYYFPHPGANFGNETRYLLVRGGDNIEKIANNLYRMGAVSSESGFLFFSRLLKKDRLMKVGRYAIKPHSSLAYIIGIITRGESTPFDITVPEGYTISQIANCFESGVEIDMAGFREAVTDRKLIDSLGIQAPSLEGYLAPSTYNVYFCENPRRIVNRMAAHFFNSLPDSFEVKAKRLGLTFHQAVTLASLIEKEAMLDSERPIISAVYLNRLRRGMKLDCDPTVIYAMGGLDRPLLRGDLDYDSPYNTYLYAGLPPGPIANPGVKSLEAAVEPAPVGYLYFVARGNGSHVFSLTLDDHINAIQRIKRLNGQG